MKQPAHAVPAKCYQVFKSHVSIQRHEDRLSKARLGWLEINDMSAKSSWTGVLQWSPIKLRCLVGYNVTNVLYFTMHGVLFTLELPQADLSLQH